VKHSGSELIFVALDKLPMLAKAMPALAGQVATAFEAPGPFESGLSVCGLPRGFDVWTGPAGSAS
jgi:hypothetical protein